MRSWPPASVLAAALLAAAIFAAPARADVTDAGSLHLAQVGSFSSPTYATGPPGDPSPVLGGHKGGPMRPPRHGAPPAGLAADSSAPSNPFFGPAIGADEVWAYGLRNPWRFAFDRLTGDLVIGDVGEREHEEVDFQPAGFGGGANYGWNLYEGNARF